MAGAAGGCERRRHEQRRRPAPLGQPARRQAWRLIRRCPACSDTEDAAAGAGSRPERAGCLWEPPSCPWLPSLTSRGPPVAAAARQRVQQSERPRRGGAAVWQGSQRALSGTLMTAATRDEAGGRCQGGKKPGAAREPPTPCSDRHGGGRVAQAISCPLIPLSTAWRTHCHYCL